MWKFLSPSSCFTTRDFSSRSGRELENNVLELREIPQLPLSLPSSLVFLLVGKPPGSLLFLPTVSNHQKETLWDGEKREVVSRMGRHVQFVMTPPRGDPLKSNSISMYFPYRDQREKEILLPRLLTTPPRRGLCCIPPSKAPTPSPPRPGRWSLTNREELLLRMVLALPKAAEMREKVR